MRYAMMLVVMAGLSQGVVMAQQTGAPEGTTAEATKVSYPTGRVFAENFKVVGEGYAFTEGPAFVADATVQPLGGYFLFCDVSPSTVLRWNGDEQAPEVYFEGTQGALGMAVKADGTLVQCRKDSRSVVEVKIEDGKVTSTTTRASDFEGKRLNATNDCVVARDGSIWFTDPPFFTPKGELELDFTGIFRVSAEGVIEAKARGVQYANGLAFSPDEKTLYVNDFRGRKVLAYSVDEKGALSAEPKVVADLAAMAKEVGAQGRGGADGLRVRSDGTILATGPGGVYGLSATGELLDFLATGSATNVAIGGADGNVALVTAGGRVVSVRLTPVATNK